MFREQAAQEGKTLEITADGSDYSVMCDQFRLSQVLNNLISNAMKYSMAQAVITVSVARTAVQKKHGQISNCDKGYRHRHVRGIPGTYF